MMKGTFDPIKNGALLPIDKAEGWSSFDVVAKLRGLLKKHYRVRKLKVGHAGTLDPMATGLLICCSGPMTKRIPEIQEGEKEYLARVRLGEETASCDAETEVRSQSPIDHIEKKKVEELLKSFQGEIQQVPPAFSAVRINGKRAYEEARKGKEPELGARSVRIDEIVLETFELPELELRIRCGKGTYIRSIARDLGDALGCGAHLSALRRTRIGEERVENAWSIETFKAFLENDRTAISTKEKKT